MWALIAVALVVVAMAAVWLVRRSKGAHHPDRGPSRTGRVARAPGDTEVAPDPGDARPAGPDAEAMGVPRPGEAGPSGRQEPGGAGGSPRAR